MSAAPIAVLDTDVIVLLVGDDKSKERTEIVRGRIQAMKERGYTFWIPTLVLAELSTAGSSLAQLARAISPKLNGLRTVEFGVAAAETCGQMVAARLAASKTGGTRYENTRAAMKFDAAIAAIAHALQAKYLVTANRRDFESLFEAVNSTTQVHRADVPDLNFAYQPPLIPTDSDAGNKVAILKLPAQPK